MQNCKGALTRAQAQGEVNSDHRGRSASLEGGFPLVIHQKLIGSLDGREVF